MRRRLAAVLALAVTLPAVPGAAAKAPEPRRLPYAKGGTLSILPVRPGEELLRRLEPMAVTPEGERVLQAIARKTGAGSHDGDDHRLAMPMESPDLNGDGASEIVIYDSEYEWTNEYVLEGDTTFTVVDGRTGRALWRKKVALPVPMVAFVRVGSDRGRPGIVAYGPVGDLFHEDRLRIVSLGGARGETVFDRTISSTDGLGEVNFGGFLDAVPNGGVDVLIARTQYLGLRLGASVAGIRWPQADLSQVFVIDGRNGRMFEGSERMIGLGGYVGIVAGGDYDRDKRDDFLVFRWGVRGRGSITARSLTEDRVLWANESVPLGNLVTIPERETDMVGDTRDDLLIQTRINEFPLVQVPGVTDEMVFFSHDPNGTHAILFDGSDGSTEMDRWDADLYWPIEDVTGDRKNDLMVLDAFMDARRAGFVFSVGRARGADVYTREVSLPVDVPLLAAFGGQLMDAGDVDGDRVRDTWYDLGVGTTSVTLRRTRGFLLTRTGRTVTTGDFPLTATLDARGTDRFGVTYDSDGTGETYEMRDGLTGRAYWRVYARVHEKDVFVAPVPVSGARGRRCANVVIVSVGLRDRMGEMWGTGLDGRTGRVVWSRALNDMADRPTVAPRGGTAAPCG